MQTGNNSPLGLYFHLGSDPVCIGLSLGLDSLFSEYLSSSRSLTDYFVDHVSDTLSKWGYSFKSLDFITLTHGPGRYTSVRIGIVTANTLSQALAIPIYSLSSLAAYVWPHADHDGVYLSVLETRKPWHVAALYRVSNGLVEALTPEFLWDVTTLAPILSLFKAPLKVVGQYDPLLLSFSPYLQPALTPVTLEGMIRFSNFARLSEAPLRFAKPHYAHPPVIGPQKGAR